MSTASSVQSGLCSLLVLSTRESFLLGVCLLGICPLGSLATYYSAHIAWYQLSVRSIVDSADVQSCLLLSLATLKFCPLRIVSIICSVNSGLYSILVQSTLESVGLGLCLL